ncbi:MAG TPA: NAD(P)H-dependent oxidoreductase [Deltaproteobacteria bacterium]|jgi:hypothetical protein|nr:NAD(P)H-dependent oxidoreductase [Deltaproteobacteria bacterium]HQI02894.1 NAD(P)H-dependent oxidoreductase [Deltaproteobacteria bacterium]HQJ07924.1 NAD(P)H-dependent oxidoreductase [Deltaproteobacteria bacterium]
MGEEKSGRTVHVLGIAGSLRQGSYNKSALRAALKVAPAGMEIEIFDLEGIPPFNQDNEQNPPAICAGFQSIGMPSYDFQPLDNRKEHFFAKLDLCNKRF